jgi:hypothetical protein
MDTIMDMDMDMIDMESNKVNGGAKSVRIRNYKQAFVYLTNFSKIDSSARITGFRLVEEAEMLYIYTGGLYCIRVQLKARRYHGFAPVLEVDQLLYIA